MTPTAQDDFWNQLIDWEAYEEVTLTLLDDRRGDNRLQGGGFYVSPPLPITIP
jgi:hypothetical protein